MCPVPRVSDDHLAARRRQILDAARVCFMRDGFHTASMQDVIAEAGLSVGAVYRYFKSKNELIAAIAEEVVSGLTEQFGAMIRDEPDLPLVDALDRALQLLDTQTGPDGSFRLAMQVWAAAALDPELRQVLAARYAAVRLIFADLARAARDRGELAPDADVDAVAAVLFGAMPGYGVQHVLTGKPDRPTYLAGLQALLHTARRTDGSVVSDSRHG